MEKSLGQLVQDKRSLSLAGMCKNAGKTTVFNRIVREIEGTDMNLGLTSIGRDGEAVDVVTGTGKPGIYVKEGTIIGTAMGLLKACDITQEILGKTGIHTPMGEVILVRARSDGNVQLAGPSTNTQLMEISRQFKIHGVDKIIIDGAISRKSLCSTKVAQSVILSTGASCGRNIDLVVRETQFAAEILDLCVTKIPFAQLPSQEMEGNASPEFSIWNQYGEMMDLPLEEKGFKQLDHILRNKSMTEWKWCFIPGALTDVLLKPILMSNTNLKKKEFIVLDSSKILLSRDCYEKLRMKGGSLGVFEKTDLLAITINPFSAYGFHFDQSEFMEKMRTKVRQPVFDVMEDEDGKANY